MWKYQRTNKNRGKLLGFNKSPLHSIEETIAEFALKKSLIKHLFTQDELIDFTNILIKYIPFQKYLIAW